MDKRAIVLLSGGLDSMLAAAILLEQGLAVTGLAYRSPFFGPDKALAAASRLGIDLTVVDIGAELLALVKNPPSGWGKHLNPCIDCHALMVRGAARLAAEQGDAVLATGEVLGQRPFSQTKNALHRVAALGGTEILRPLSARLLKPTRWEAAGIVDRELLLDISGRGRDRQIELARRYGWTDYPAPAGGCLLTDPDYSRRLRDALGQQPALGPETAEALKYGRPFWLAPTPGTGPDKLLAVVGRNQADNLALTGLKGADDILFVMRDFPGPTTLALGLGRMRGILPGKLRVDVPTSGSWPNLIEGIVDLDGIITKIGEITAYYAVSVRGRSIDIDIVL